LLKKNSNSIKKNHLSNSQVRGVILFMPIGRFYQFSATFFTSKNALMIPNIAAAMIATIATTALDMSDMFWALLVNVMIAAIPFILVLRSVMPPTNRQAGTITGNMSVHEGDTFPSVIHIIKAAIAIASEAITVVFLPRFEKYAV